MKKIRSFFYFILALILLVYGLPRFELGEMQEISMGFAILWSAFAMLVIGAHLYDFLGVGQETVQNLQVEAKIKERVRVRA